MGFFNNFPYTNFHEINLDFILKTINDLENNSDRLRKEFIKFTIKAGIKFAEPIEYSSETEYEQGTIVLYNGDSFLSKKDVPKNISPENDEYWAKIGNYNAQIAKLEQYKYRVNAKEMGAVGDGITNDTAAFENAKKETGDYGFIYLPYGKYILDDSFDFNGSIQMAYGSSMYTPEGELHHLLRPVNNLFNKVIGKSVQTNVDPCILPREANILESLEMTATDTKEFSINGTIGSGENVITTSSNTSGILPGYAVICDAEGWPDGENITQSIRVVKVTSQGIIVAKDFGDGSGAAVNNWSWSGPQYTGKFTIRQRMWKCPSFVGVESGYNHNPDAIHWCANDVATSNGQRVIGREIDVIINANSGQVDTGLLIASQNKVDSAYVALDIQSGGAHPGTWGAAVRNFGVGYYSPNNGFAFIFSPNYNPNGGGGDGKILGGLIQEGLKSLHLRPSVGVGQIIDGASAIVSEAIEGATAGKLYQGLDGEGSTVYAVDIDGTVFAKTISFNQLATTEVIECDHTLTVRTWDGRSFKIPCKLL